MNYVKEFDGIRGAAIAFVMLFHFGYFAFGWAGVQIFFVLSGYLITTILIQDRSAPIGAYLGRFYWRRTLRIFPLYYFFLLVTTVVWIAIGVPKAFPNDWPWLFGYAANFARLREGDLPTYVHTWSLALEEQFYLIWPLTIFFLSPARLKTTIIALLVCVPLLRFATFHALLSYNYDQEFAGRAVYGLPFTQFDAFAAGAAITVFKLERLQNATRWFFLIVALAAIAGSVTLSIDYIFFRSAYFASLGFPMFLIGYHKYVWGYSLINAVAAIGIICTLQKAYFTRILNFPGLSRLGKISYGAYVYHLPLLYVGHSLFVAGGAISRALFFAAWAAVTIFISELSFRYLETPFLKLKNRFSVRSVDFSRRAYYADPSVNAEPARTIKSASAAE